MSNDSRKPPAPTDSSASDLQAELAALDQDMQQLLHRRFTLVSQLNSAGHRPLEPDAGEIVRTLQQLESAPSADNGKPSDVGYAEQESIRERITSIFTEVVAHCRDSVKPFKIAYLGPEGTFTQAAVFKYFGQSTATAPFTAIDDVFRAVESGECQLGVVPIENSIEGTINRTLDRITDSPLGICGEEILRIEHNLLSRAASIGDISVVHAHPQALAQCRKWLNANLPAAQQVAASSNAAGAELAQLDDKAAAIASLNAGEIYKLPALEKNIEDDLSNTTRFIVIGSQQAEQSDNDITTLVVSAPHKPGGLRKMLEPFDEAGISMTRIESRPAREELWSYLFFIDVAGHKDDKVLSHALQQLSDETRYMRILGSYPTVRY